MSEITPHVSILIPLLNEEAIVDSCAAAWGGLIASLSCGCELIFIDDGSTDSTPARLEALESRHDFIRSIRNSGSGQHRALADGLKAARGDIVVTGDADLFPAAADLAAALRLASEGGLVIMRREMERCLLRRVFSLANNGLLSFLSGRHYGDIGSMQMCFRRPDGAILTQLPLNLYLPLQLEAAFRRVEIPAAFEAAARSSRYSLEKLTRLLSVELQSLGDLPDNRHPLLLSVLNGFAGGLLRLL